MIGEAGPARCTPAAGWPIRCWGVTQWPNWSGRLVSVSIRLAADGRSGFPEPVRTGNWRGLAIRRRWSKQAVLSWAKVIEIPTYEVSQQSVGPEHGPVTHDVFLDRHGKPGRTSVVARAERSVP